MGGDLPPNIDHGTGNLNEQGSCDDGHHKVGDVQELHQVDTKEITEDEFIRLVSINGVASMIGIARGKIESISSSIYNNGKVVIPFVNVVEYYKELEKQLKESGAGHH